MGAQPVCRRVPRTVRGGTGRARSSSANTKAPTCSPSASPALILSATRSVRAARRSRTCTRISIGRSARCSTRSTRRSARIAGSSPSARITASRRFRSSSSPRARTPAASTPPRSSRPSSKPLRPALGQGKHVTVLATNDLYFEPGVYDKIEKAKRPHRRRHLGDRGAPRRAARLPERTGAGRRPLERCAAARGRAQLRAGTQRRSDPRDQARLDDLGAAARRTDRPTQTISASRSS